MLKRMKKGLDVQLSAHVKSYEIECNCGDPRCKALFYDTELLEKFEILRLIWGEAIQINSGHRCCLHNFDVQGAKQSTHMIGMALDLVCPTHVDWTWFQYSCEEIFEFTFAYENCHVVHCDIYIRD